MPSYRFLFGDDWWGRSLDLVLVVCRFLFEHLKIVLLVLVRTSSDQPRQAGPTSWRFWQLAVEHHVWLEGQQSLQGRYPRTCVKVRAVCGAGSKNGVLKN